MKESEMIAMNDLDTEIYFKYLEHKDERDSEIILQATGVSIPK